MDVQFDEITERKLREAAAAHGKEPAELVRDIAVEYLEANGTAEDAGEQVVRRQREALRELHEKLDAIGEEGLPEPEGRPMSERHDDVLYRKPS